MPGPYPRRHGAHMIGNTGRGLGPGTPDPGWGQKDQFQVCHWPSPLTVPRRGGQRSFPHIPVVGTEAWKDLAETGNVGASPPLSSQDPGMLTSLGVASSTSAPPPSTSPHLWPLVPVLQRRRLRNQGTHRTGRGLCQVPKSGRLGTAAALPALARRPGMNPGQGRAGFRVDEDRGAGQPGG